MQKSAKIRVNQIQNHIKRIIHHDPVGLIPTGIRNSRVVQPKKINQRNIPHQQKKKSNDHLNFMEIKSWIDKNTKTKVGIEGNFST